MAESALAEADRLDRQFASGGPVGPLHGVPSRRGLAARDIPLGARDSLALDHFCTNAVTPCRRSRPDGSTPGDYTVLAVTAGRSPIGPGPGW